MPPELPRDLAAEAADADCSIVDGFAPEFSIDALESGDAMDTGCVDGVSPFVAMRPAEAAEGSGSSGSAGTANDVEMEEDEGGAIGVDMSTAAELRRRKAERALRE